MNANLPKHVNYWMTSSEKHDCFFNIGPESGPKDRIGAIKMLLFGHSEVFQKMLDESPLAERGDVAVPDSDPDTFKNYLRCIYGGTDIVVRKLSFEKCLSLIYLCEKYLTLEIKEKISLSILQLYQPLTVDNVLMGLSNPACLASTGNSLTNVLSRAIQNDTEQILNHNSFFDLDSNAISFIVKQDKISTKEIILWKAVLNWGRKKINSEDPKDLRSCLKNILKHIRFCAMEANDFCKSVVPSKVLTPEEVFEICNSIGSRNAPKLDGLCCQTLHRFKSPTNEITFTYVFNSIKEFTGSVTSSQFKLGEFNWTTKLIRNDGKDELGIYLYCNSASLKSSWKCYVTFEFVLVNHCGGPNLTEKSSFGKEFCHTSNAWGFRRLINFEDLLNIEMGYIKNNAVEVVTHVELQSEET